MLRSDPISSTAKSDETVLRQLLFVTEVNVAGALKIGFVLAAACTIVLSLQSRASRRR
jgi:hypothetical protein